MRPVDLAYKYLEIFFSGRDLERLYDILADDLKFSGPFYEFTSAREYVETLVAQPPVECAYKILYVFEKGSAVNLIYEFSKPETRAKISQIFEIRDAKIAVTLLIFDSSQFL